MRENRDFVVPVNILTTFARASFSRAARHTTLCLDSTPRNSDLMPICVCTVVKMPENQP